METKNQQKIQEIIKTLKPIFQKEKEVLFCYLFGSFANGNPISSSDIDIAVYLDDKKCLDFFEKRLELIPKISKLSGKQADITILNNASLFMKYVVLKEGKLIFERNCEKRIIFELKSTNEYFDFKPALEMYNKELLAS
ncbi:nucleotidyltransferase domain-containing protein [Patescibacteria group bacterium]|nr:nucleotidyltransferase domain-containing protein [Patescibacteria group bacterium]